MFASSKIRDFGLHLLDLILYCVSSLKVYLAHGLPYFDFCIVQIAEHSKYPFICHIIQLKPGQNCKL